MENEFSKPKILIDLEEYEYLRECQEWYENDDEITEQILDFLYTIKDFIGTNYFEYEKNKTLWKFYDFLNVDRGFIAALIEAHITSQTIIDRELNKQKENK